MSPYRLPTLDELITLFSGQNKTDLFGEEACCWSSTPGASGLGLWVVVFASRSYTCSPHAHFLKIRGVRQESQLAINEAVDPSDPHRLVDNGDGTHTDRRTSLVWSSRLEDGKYDLSDALAHFSMRDPALALPSTVSVDAHALRLLLNAVTGPSHYIRELQMTRRLSDNPINLLIAQLNQAVTARSSEPS